MYMEHVPEGVMRESHEGDGDYLSFPPSATYIKFFDKAYLASGAKCLDEVTCEVQENHDITEKIQNFRKTEMRKIHLIYPGFEDDHRGISTIFPLDNVVLKMRPHVGWMRRIRKDGSAEGYGLSHLRVGIPADVFMVIWNSVNRALSNEAGEDWRDRAAVYQDHPPHSAFSVPGIECRSGHYWISATVHHPLQGVISLRDATALTVSVVDTLKAFKKSLRCDAATAFRLIRLNEGQWELRMTLWSVAIKDLAAQYDPIRISSRAPVGRDNVDSSPGITSAFDSLAL